MWPKVCEDCGREIHDMAFVTDKTRCRACHGRARPQR